MESVKAAVKGSLKDIPDDLRYSITDANGKDSYPISGTVWAVVYDHPPAGRAAGPRLLPLGDARRPEVLRGTAITSSCPSLVERVDEKLRGSRNKRSDQRSAFSESEQGSLRLSSRVGSVAVSVTRLYLLTPARWQGPTASANSDLNGGAVREPPCPRGAARRTLPPMRRFQHLQDHLFRMVCQGAAVLVLVLAALLLLVLVWQSMLAIRTLGTRFFVDTDLGPRANASPLRGLAFVWGTVATSAIAMLIAVPLGVGTATFLAEIAPRWLRRAGSFLVEMLAVVPSVVYGFWGLFVLSPFLQDVHHGPGRPQHGRRGHPARRLDPVDHDRPLRGRGVLRCDPGGAAHAARGALALGSSRWQTIWHVILPYARPGIIGGSFLALGRALGETMAVTMLIGNKTQIESVSPRHGQFHSERHRQRVHRGDLRPVPVRAGRIGAGAADGQCRRQLAGAGVDLAGQPAEPSALRCRPSAVRSHARRFFAAGRGRRTADFERLRAAWVSAPACGSTAS